MKKVILTLMLALVAPLMANTTTQDDEIFMCKRVLVDDVVSQSTYVSYSNNYALFVDKLSIKKTGNILRFWTTSVNFTSNNTAYADNEGYTKVMVEMNIKNKTYRMVSATGYDCSGAVSQNYGKTASPWDYVVPDSMYEALLQEVTK